MFGTWDRALAQAVADAKRTGLRYRVATGPQWAGHSRWLVAPLAEAVGHPHQDVVDALAAGLKKAPSPPAAEVRAWAAANGVTVASRGRIPQPVLDAFTSARQAVG